MSRRRAVLPLVLILTAVAAPALEWGNPAVVTQSLRSRDRTYTRIRAPGDWGDGLLWPSGVPVPPS